MRKWLKKVLPEKIPAFGAVFYNFLPARMFEPHYRDIASAVSLREGSVLVDVGTGPGWLPIEIARLSPAVNIIGIDLSEKMIAIAQKNKQKYAESKRVNFLVMNAAAMEFADNSLDMVISTGTMHHWKEPVKVINEIFRCLKPGCEAWIYDGYAQASDEAIARGIKPLIPGFPPRRLVRKILGLHGFSQSEYDTGIKAMAAQTRFGTCVFENCGIMMRLRFRKGGAGSG